LVYAAEHHVIYSIPIEFSQGIFKMTYWRSSKIISPHARERTPITPNWGPNATTNENFRHISNSFFVLRIKFGADDNGDIITLTKRIIL
jgi:hypothetical protein